MEGLYAQGVLSQILSHLSNYKDIVVCAAVSTAWRDAARDYQLSSLHIPGADCVTDSVDTTLPWIQSLHSKGKFAQLRCLTVVCDDQRYHSCGRPTAMHSLVQCVIMMTGFWQLQYCCLEGEIHIAETACLLPPSLQHLRLRPEECFLRKELFLSAFSRLTVLKTLAVHLPTNMPDPDTDTGSFVLDTVFPVLTHLYLLPLCLASDVIKERLPRLQHLVAYVSFMM